MLNGVEIMSLKERTVSASSGFSCITSSLLLKAPSTTDCFPLALVALNN